MMQSGDPVVSKVHWANSLIARVVALCVVLVLCLLGSVYVLTVHFLKEVRQEYEKQTLAMLSDLGMWFERHPGEIDDVASAQQSLEQKYPGARVDIVPTVPSEQSTEITTEITDQGIRLKGRYTLTQEGMPSLDAVIESTIPPQDVMFAAFTNRYIALLTISFVVALALMIYFIVKSLRPLRDLSKSCARISAGELAPVEIKRNYGEVLALEQTFNKMVDALRDKEQIEANLRQAQRLSALGSLAAGVAHDVRNPLNAIKLLSSHALDTLDESGAENGTVQQLRTIRKEVDRLEDIVSGFLALAKERELQPEPVKIDLVIDECVSLASAEADARSVRLTAELGAGDLQLEVDPKQLRRAVLNVVINAIEACNAGGRVRVITRIAEEDYQIEVRDDGPGLSKDVAERAFDPYFTTKSTGTGIGLSITRGIVEEHGGTVSLSCTLGMGCQALIALPLRRKVMK
ncbi:MAG TPA: ATP-binding protein [Candidatus Hydrogenedentes bacterium]|nr:ATP-binding protein [Candidatus Hydrogenedentota bacterium]